MPDEFFARGRMAAGFVAAPLLVFMLPLIGLYLVVMILLLETLVR